MGIFGKSFNREIGKNTGKWMSNKVFGDGHATPYKLKVKRENAKIKEKERQALEKQNEKKQQHQKELAEIRASAKKPASVRKAEIEAELRERELAEQRRIAEVQAEASKSDEVRLKELEVAEKKHKREVKTKIVGVAIVAVLLLGYFVYHKLTSLPCESVQECIALNEFEIAKSHLSGDFLDRGEATNIIQAEVSYLSSLGQYKEAYNAIAFLKGYDFGFSSIYAEKKKSAVNQCIQTIVEEAILNDQKQEARKYAKFHSDPNSLENLFE